MPQEQKPPDAAGEAGQAAATAEETPAPRPARREGSPETDDATRQDEAGGADEVKDSTAEFEAALTHAEEDQQYVLRLYVTGTTPRSRHAIQNLRRLCEEYLHGRYHLEVIDIYQHPELAGQAQIIAAPTLVRQLPLPLRRFIGDLSDRERILAGLELKPAPPEPEEDDG